MRTNPTISEWFTQLTTVLTIFWQQCIAWSKQTVQQFMTNEVIQTDNPIPTHSLNIAHIFSVLVGTCAIIVYPMAYFRKDMNEVGDRFLVMAIICTAVLTFLFIQFLPHWYEQIKHTLWAKITLIGITSVFLIFGFREENFYTDFVGFGSIFLGILVLFTVVLDILRSTIAYKILKPLTILLNVYIIFMGIDAVLINVSVTDNFYIINDMLSPLTSLKSYTDYIPGYVNLFQHFPRFLNFVGITAYPQLTMNVIYIFFEFLCIVTIAIAVHLNYRFMVHRSIWIALIFTVPVFFIATRPFWNYELKYYALHLFFYSLIPVRIFTVLAVGSLSVWLLKKTHTGMIHMLGYGFLSGLISSIGMYQSNDFGLFAVIAVVTMIVFQPFQSWRNCIQLAVIYVISTVIGLGILLVLNTDIATVNPDYLYLWIRGSVAGFGSVLISFPGNGLMVIITIIAVWLCTFILYLDFRRYATIYRQDALIENHFAALIYVATVAVLGMSYYINHSVFSFQGSSMYICLSIALFLLYQLLLRRSAQQSLPTGIRYATLVPQLFVLLPIVIGLIHTPVYNRLFQDGMAIKKIISSDANTMIDTPEYNELQIEYLNNVHTALQPLQLKIAFVGAFANIVELYTHIPAASIVNHPSAVEIGKPILDLYCHQVERAPYDIFITNQYTANCENMLIITSQTINATLYVHKDFPQKHPAQWQQLRNVDNFCLVNGQNGEINCTAP